MKYVCLENPDLNIDEFTGNLIVFELDGDYDMNTYYTSYLVSAKIQEIESPKMFKLVKERSFIDKNLFEEKVKSGKIIVINQ